MAKRLFEQGGDVTPSLDMRVASGKAGTATENSTWQTIITWLESVLGFLKISNNLSDLTDDATARTNLDVYSTGEVDTALGNKADTSNVLTLDNTTPFTPNSDYEPATNKQINAMGFVCLGKGWFDKTGALLGWIRNDSATTSLTITTEKLATGSYKITFNTNQTDLFFIANTWPAGDGAQSRMIAVCDFPFSSVAQNYIGIKVSRGEGEDLADANVYFQIFKTTF